MLRGPPGDNPVGGFCFSGRRRWVHDRDHRLREDGLRDDGLRGDNVRFRRSRFVFFCVEDEAVFDLAALLQGSLQEELRPTLKVLSPFQAERLQVSIEEAQFLLSLPSDRWLEPHDLAPDAPSLPQETMERWIQMGLVITDGSHVDEARLRKWEEDLWRCQWHPDAVVYHAMTRLSGPAEGEGFDVREVSSRAEGMATAFVERVGPPPPTYVSFDDTAKVPLPTPTAEGELFDLLLCRKTVRTFDRQQSLPVERLATVLRYTFGAFGQARLAPGLDLLHKTSPSGGSLHPIEAFPLILNVRGVAPGLYHYDIREHALSPLVSMDAEEARSFAQKMGNGQLFVGEAHAVVVLAARFFRNQWKYRRTARTYSVMLMDAGHLSQVFYLVAEKLELGAFYTGAVDSRLIEETLSLNPAEFGVVGLCGCGIATSAAVDPDGGGLPFGPIPSG